MSLRIPAAAILFAAVVICAAKVQAAPSEAVFAYTGSGYDTALLVNGTSLLQATGRGWYDVNDAGGAMSASANYLAGVCGTSDFCGGDNLDRHDYFVFDLSGISGPIVSAELQLDQPLDAGGMVGHDGYISPTGSLTYDNFDVSTPIADLGAVALPGAFADLGSGALYASTVLKRATNGTTVDIDLDGSALGAMNRALGGSFAIGGAVELVPLPEPSTWAAMTLGLSVLGLLARSRRARARPRHPWPAGV